MAELIELQTWTNFKDTCITRKNLNCQFGETTDRYELYGPEGNILWRASLVKSDPRNEDQVDFEDNYKSQAFNLPIGTMSRESVTDYSGTTSSSPGISSQIVPVNKNRKYFFIQNVGTDTIWFNFTTPATQGQPSIQLDPRSSFVLEGSSVSPEAINVVSRLASISFTAKEK